MANEAQSPIDEKRNIAILRHLIIRQSFELRRSDFVISFSVMIWHAPLI
jgi:hypothetical protein